MINKIQNNAFAKNSIILFIGTMVASALNYIFHLAVGRMVSVTVYGEVESLISLVSIISVPAGSLAMLITKFSAGNKADNDRAGSHRLLNYYNKKIAVYGLPILLVAIILSPFLKDFLKIESVVPLFIVWFMMLLSFFGAVTGGVLSGWQKFTQSSWGGVWGAFFKLVSFLIFIRIGFGLNGALGSFAVGSLASYIISLYFLKFIWERKSGKKGCKNKTDPVFLKKFIWPVLLGNLAIAILSNVDMILAKHNLDPDLAGQYGALTIISKIIFFVTGVMATVLFSMSSEDSHKKNSSRATLKQAFLLTFLASAAALIFYYLFPEFIMSLLFGNKYVNVAPYLIWFATSVVLFSFVNLIFQYLISIHETKIAYGILTVSIAASFLISFVGYGIFAIITIMIAAQTLALLLGVYFLFKKTLKITK
ncbi:MAG TPA: oligosaccharide flippase family protein [Candidatus Moranbacteria bacterium]|nr:oligosaccharide flippase family protein [Candidatus Moranbacteria bacterium]